MSFRGICEVRVSSVHVVGADGRGERRLTGYLAGGPGSTLNGDLFDLSTSPTWWADGRQLFYLTEDGLGAMAMNADGTCEHPFGPKEFPAETTWRPGANPTVEPLGTDGSDRLTGTGRGDSICGLSGADVIHAGAGNDRIDGGAGNDTIYPGPGRDTVFGGEGRDTIYAADGQRDVIDCESYRDTAYVDKLDVFRNCERVHLVRVGQP